MLKLLHSLVGGLSRWSPAGTWRPLAGLSAKLHQPPAFSQVPRQLLYGTCEPTDSATRWLCLDMFVTVFACAVRADVPTAPDQALKRTGAGARKAAAPCSPCALGSSMLSTAHAAADGSAVIRKRPQQQHGSKSSLRAATPSPRPSTRRPAQQAAPRSPKLLHAPSISRLAPVRIDTCPDSDISAPSSSPCADSPAAFAWTGAHAEPCADLSCSASMPSHGCIEHAVDTSPVAGLLDPTQQVPAPQQGSLLQAGADNSQHALATGLGSGGSSSGNCFSTSGQDSVLLRTVLQHHAGLAQQPPAQLGATRGGFAEPMHACTGLLPAQSPAAQPGYSTAQPAMPAECTPGVLATTNRQLHVTFAPLPPSKNIWLQQLRQMSPESKNKFLRRLQSVGRKMWCMWRKRRHQHTGMDRPAHGLKRDWQQAAAESGMDSVDEPAVSPCKRLVYTGAE